MFWSPLLYPDEQGEGISGTGNPLSNFQEQEASELTLERTIALATSMTPQSSLLGCQNNLSKIQIILSLPYSDPFNGSSQPLGFGPTFQAPHGLALTDFSIGIFCHALPCPQTVNSLRIPSLAPLSPRRILHLEHFIQDHGFKNHLYVRTLFFWSGLLSPAPKQHLQLSRHMISSLGRQRYLKLNCLKQKPIPLTALRCLSSPGQQSLPPSTQPLQSFLTPPSLTAHTVTLPPSPGKFPAKVSRTSSIFLLSYMTLP